MGVDIGGARQGVSEFLKVTNTEPLGICYNIAAVLNLIFDYPHLEKGCL